MEELIVFTLLLVFIYRQRKSMSSTDRLLQATTQNFKPIQFALFYTYMKKQ